MLYQYILKSGYGYKQTKQLLDNVCDFKSDGIAEFFGTSLVSVYKDIIFYPGGFPISFLLSKDLDQHLLFILASLTTLKTCLSGIIMECRVTDFVKWYQNVDGYVSNS